MDAIVRVKGNVQRFDGDVWNDVALTIPMEITIIGTVRGWTHANVEGDVPIRWLELDPSVRVDSAEPVLL